MATNNFTGTSGTRRQREGESNNNNNAMNINPTLSISIPLPRSKAFLQQEHQRTLATADSVIVNEPDRQQQNYSQRLYCTLCRAGPFRSEKDMQVHLDGKPHQRALRAQAVAAESQQKAQSSNNNADDDDNNNHPVAEFAGVNPSNIFMVNNNTAANTAREILLNCDVLGFDTESKPTFQKGEESTGPHLVQFANDTHAWLFPMWLPAARAVVKEVIESPSVRKIGFDLRGDRDLCAWNFGIQLVNCLDVAEQMVDGEPLRGTVHAVAKVLGVVMKKSKKVTQSNWANRSLKQNQILYAANDAFAALKTYRGCEERKIAMTVMPNVSVEELRNIRSMRMAKKKNRR